MLGAEHPTGQHPPGAGTGQDEVPADTHWTLGQGTGPGLELGLSLGLNPHLDQDCTTCGFVLGSVFGFRSGFGTGFRSTSGFAFGAEFGSTSGLAFGAGFRSSSGSESGTCIFHKGWMSLFHPLLSKHSVGAQSTITPRGVHYCPLTLPWAAWGPSGGGWGLQQCDRSPGQGAEGRDEMAAVPLALAVFSGASGAERAPRRSRGQGGG